MKRAIITAIALTATLVGWGQRPQLTAHVEPDSVMIGDRFDLVLEVDKDQVQVVEFPYFKTDSTGFELYKSHPIDTIKRDGRQLKLRKRYTLAAFQEGNLNLGVAQVFYADKNTTDTIFSTDSLRLNVATFEIDTAKQKIHDIKPLRTMPFKWAEISGYVMWGALGLFILTAIILLIVRYLVRNGKLTKLFKPEPPQPPHIVAISSLEKLHNQKLWQNNRHKEYYSQLTDILRTYLDGRYGVGAMEMTTDEIVVALRAIELPKKESLELVNILKSSDLVKFAKATPDNSECEEDYLKAYYFVEETKLIESTNEEEATQN